MFQRDVFSSSIFSSIHSCASMDVLATSRATLRLLVNYRCRTRSGPRADVPSASLSVMVDVAPPLLTISYRMRSPSLDHPVSRQLLLRVFHHPGSYHRLRM